MLADVLFPDELQLHVDRIEMEQDTVEDIYVTSAKGRSICPRCQTISERVHSICNRHPADLPLAGYTVRLDMTVHRFFCDNGGCEAKTFTERITAFIQHYARRTNRRQQSVAIEAGGASGQRVLERGSPGERRPGRGGEAVVTRRLHVATIDWSRP